MCGVKTASLIRVPGGAVSRPLIGSRCSIVVSIPACHAGDPGSIPGSGAAATAANRLAPVV
uniref:Uncharacterized protein n=1 Tax=Physcomitrium patens TaxID=3218 RepID=A0A2K1IQE1_PHYPA|nr:hypothetical protein PHYPA_025611 [Physcomitrium patens]PNR31491.1 hypothetical protein PHYPA_025612 [Physcomitrium patens]PNR31492.1 hypothetical protein PHYPA_025613 [Physcomitrium patens]PNR31493.1 hypothetical protein PHYPA_025614 [Physcomitrium patens]PNR31494.1 hypothetical protein PHYPA_025615 [Physcomitrium patens]